MGRLNAGEMVARVWILTHSKDSIAFAGGLDQGRYGRAKCWGNGSQSNDSEATIGLHSFANGLNQDRYGRAKC